MAVGQGGHRSAGEVGACAILVHVGGGGQEGVREGGPQSYTVVVPSNIFIHQRKKKGEKTQGGNRVTPIN